MNHLYGPGPRFARVDPSSLRRWRGLSIFCPTRSPEDRDFRLVPATASGIFFAVLLLAGCATAPAGPDPIPPAIAAAEANRVALARNILELARQHDVLLRATAAARPESAGDLVPRWEAFRAVLVRQVAADAAFHAALASLRRDRVSEAAAALGEIKKARE